MNKLLDDDSDIMTIVHHLSDKMAIMLKYYIAISLTSCLIRHSFANDIGVASIEDEKKSLDEIEILNDLETLIEKIEDLSTHAEKTIKKGILPIEYTNKIYSNIKEKVEELVDLNNETTNIYKFLNAKGIERIVLPNIGIPYPPLKRQLLLLIKNLFDVAPITTNAVIPVGVVDKILDIFERDNLAFKAHALDILYIWLPDNLAVQTRVMKMKGLEPFYKQIPKLDVDVIRQLLDLFNKILVEHVKARKKDVQRNKADQDKNIMYQRIGLIERLSTPAACNGLLHILETTWSFNTEEKDISQQIIDTVKNVRPFCLNFFKANPKRTKLFHELLKYVEDPSRKNNFETLGENFTDTQIILKEYSNIFNNVISKDEF